MKTVFFKISDKQAKEVEELMKDEGYTSKAEFFRFLLKFFKYEKRAKTDKERLGESVRKLEETVIRLREEGRLDNLPSLHEQLKDV